MKIAYLILTHKNPIQLERLINALDHSAFDFYIHLDKKVNFEPFAFLNERKNIFFIKNRVDVQWGAYSLVQAELNGIEEILETNKYDYLTVLSAQDFPIKSADFIYDFFIENNGTEFISCIPFSEKDEWWKEAAPRIKKYNFHNWKFKGKYRLQFLYNALTPERKFPLKQIPAGRSQWFSITTEAARYMIDFLKTHPSLIRFYKYVWGADEFIFSSTLYNSPFKDKLKDHLFYIDWSEKKPNPKVLRRDDFETLAKSDKLFARKFDVDVDSEILDMIEDYIEVKKV